MDKSNLKNKTIIEFTRAADKYEGDSAGVYKMCRNDYPDILEELCKEDFVNILDAGCGTAPLTEILAKKFPDKHFIGIDLTPKMVEVARAKNIKNAEFTVGDCESLPFAEDSFDAVICSMSFHHYTDPRKFFFGVKRVLKPGGRLILRDMTVPKILKGFVNHIELPLLNLFGYGDVRVYDPEDIKSLCAVSGLVPECVERRRGLRLHCVIRKK